MGASYPSPFELVGEEELTLRTWKTGMAHLPILRRALPSPPRRFRLHQGRRRASRRVRGQDGDVLDRTSFLLLLLPLLSPELTSLQTYRAKPSSTSTSSSRRKSTSRSTNTSSTPKRTSSRGLRRRLFLELRTRERRAEYEGKAVQKEGPLVGRFGLYFGSGARERKHRSRLFSLSMR
jgi:hypothetical protein